MNDIAKRRLRTSRFALSVYWLVMFVGSHIPPALPQRPTQFDKVVHFGAFGTLAFLIAHYRNQLGRMTRSAYVMIFVIVAVYGVFDELTQPHFGRTAEWLDWLADLAGALAGLCAYWLYDKKWRKQTLNVV